MALFMAGRHLFESAQGRSVVSVAAIIASGVNQDGRREILGLGLGDQRPKSSGGLPLRRLRQRA